MPVNLLISLGSVEVEWLVGGQAVVTHRGAGEKYPLTGQLSTAWTNCTFRQGEGGG